MPTKFVRRSALATAAMLFCLVPTALAAKGGGGSGSTTSSITGPVLVYDGNGNGLANWGDTVTFNVSTTATTQPYVNLRCFQNGTLVLNGWDGFFAGALNSNYNFGLDSGAWQGGAADCNAYLEMAVKRGWQQLAVMSFHVDA